jgi:ectoine hydroxylase-related dioxygenase (phytanoyl-CoA dioxygenase family)
VTGLAQEPSEPGDLLCFSGAHVHAGVPNSSSVARFGVEVRIADAGDVADDHGVPNVDGEAPRVAKDRFRHVDDGTSLTAVVGGDKNE